VSWQRVAILALGPLVIIASAYALTMPRHADAMADAAAVERAVAKNVEANRAFVKDLEAACHERAAEVLQLVEPACRTVLHPPYVLVGDLSSAELERHYRETIVPTSRALATLYFDRVPDEPVTILLFASEASYRRHAEVLDGRQQPRYAGYYERSDRRIVLNVATGNGTLAHELTHALSHFDFPNMPEWFDEGLASLVEQSEFSEDGLRLTGVSNWRLNYLLPALKRNQLRPIESLIAAGTVRPGQEAVDYAHARYLCLYLQERELLGPYYRKFRASADRDRAGLWTLRQLLGVTSLEDFDREFREWVLTLAPIFSS
jgi:hypothetical protein